MKFMFKITTPMYSFLGLTRIIFYLPIARTLPEFSGMRIPNILETHLCKWLESERKGMGNLVLI